MQLVTKSLKGEIARVWIAPKRKIHSCISPKVRDSYNDDGLTLVELLVASALFSFILVMTLNLVNTFEVSRANISARSNNTASAMTAMSEITKNLRNAVNLSSSATPLTFAAPYEIRFSTFDPTTSSTKSLEIVATFQSGSSCPCTLYENESSPENTSLQLANNLTTNQIFTFANGVTSDGKTTASVAVPATGTTSSTTLSQIAEVNVQLNVSELNTATSTTLSQVVTLSNVINGTNAAFKVPQSYGRKDSQEVEK